MAKHFKSRPLARVDRLYQRSLSLIEREMTALERESEMEGKLGHHSSKDLRDYIKLLEDMKSAQLQMEADRKSKAEQAAKAKSTAELERELATVTGAGGIAPIAASAPSGPSKP